jgi:hypothetical protein
MFIPLTWSLRLRRTASRPQFGGRARRRQLGRWLMLRARGERSTLFSGVVLSRCGFTKPCEQRGGPRQLVASCRHDLDFKRRWNERPHRRFAISAVEDGSIRLASGAFAATGFVVEVLNAAEGGGDQPVAIVRGIP